jgi:predicted CopG family antitoxin
LFNRLTLCLLYGIAAIKLEEDLRHRTQIYLQDDVYQKLKIKSQTRGFSISELIRQTVLKDLHGDEGKDARALFEKLKPLENSHGEELETYVRKLRAQGRLLQIQRDKQD